MAILYRKHECVDGDRIDLVTLDEYGSLDMLPDVLASNLHLCKMPLVLKSGTTINLPDAKNKEVKPKKIKGALW